MNHGLVRGLHVPGTIYGVLSTRIYINIHRHTMTHINIFDLLGGWDHHLVNSTRCIEVATAPGRAKARALAMEEGETIRWVRTMETMETHATYAKPLKAI